MSNKEMRLAWQLAITLVILFAASCDHGIAFSRLGNLGIVVGNRNTKATTMYPINHYTFGTISIPNEAAAYVLVDDAGFHVLIKYSSQ